MSFFLSNQNAQPVLVRDLRPGDVATLDPRPGYGLQIAGFAPCRRSGVRRVLFAGEAHTLRCNRVVWRLRHRPQPARDELVWSPGWGQR